MSKSPYAQAMETILQHHLQRLVSLFTPASDCCSDALTDEWSDKSEGKKKKLNFVLLKFVLFRTFLKIPAP